MRLEMARDAMAGQQNVKDISRAELVVNGHSVGRAGLPQRVAEQLRRMIIQCDLAPGSLISEARLCIEMGVSRTPLREALKLLMAEDLVELRPNRRPLVKPLPAGALAELYEALAGVERIAAELAATRITEAALKKLATLQARMERSHAVGGREAYADINEAIHLAIVAGAHNAVLAQTHEQLLAKARRARFAAMRAKGRWDESVEEHRAVLAALTDRDPEAAGRLLKEHVVRTGQAVTTAIKAGLPAP